MSRKVRWGVLSTALIGREKVIPAMQHSELCLIAAIASRDLATAQRVADALGIATAYGSYEELLADPSIEAIYNPLPNHLHVPWTIKALEAGKHVLCEKPFALSAREAETVIAARDKAGKLVSEAFMIRQHPQWQRVRELVRSGRIGRVRAIQTSFSYHNTDPANVRNMADIGGGGIYDIGCYAITSARYVLEAEPLRVVASLERDPAFGTDRLASGLMTFPDAVQVTFVVSTQMVPYQRVQILGTSGRIDVEIPFNAPQGQACRLFIDSGRGLRGEGIESEDIAPSDQYTRQGDDFARAILGGHPLEFGLEDALWTMKIIDALFLSAKEDRWVGL